MSNYPTDRLYTAIAASGNKTIPPETAAAAGSGRLSQQEGFGVVNSQPLTQGGIPPFRQDFNGIFNLFSQFLLWYQQGGIMKYSNAFDYEVGNEIIYQNNKYRCIQANGPASTVKAPTDAAYWEKLVNTPGAVLYNQSQSLSAAEKTQACNNIGALQSFSIDAVLYDTVQNLTAAQKLTARTNIGAMDAATYYGKTLAADSDNVYLRDQGGNTISTLAMRSDLLKTVFRNTPPQVTEILWSGDTDHGDITLDHPFTDYDCIMIIYSINDESPGGINWEYSLIPVWIMKAAIIDGSLFGVTTGYFDLLSRTAHRWLITTADSTSTSFKHFHDDNVHLWRVIGIRLTSASV